MLCIFFMVEEKGTSRRALPPFFLKVGPCKDFVVKDCPREEVNFREAFDSLDALPNSQVLIVRRAHKEVITC